ncbi:MAG: YCF48-related protein [Candidatus Krumholzibacteria bacterium]|nr:YCF48-related protein [Candidatus Krumholzibacteria bacterium]
MQLRRNILLALMIVLFVYFEIHSCSQDSAMKPEPPAELPPSMLLNATDIFFFDAGHGWVSGQLGTMIRTVDGGATWEAARVDNLDIRGISFVDADCGWACGNDGKIYRTLDGGLTWDRRIFTGTPQMDDLFAVDFVSPDRGYLLGYSGVFVTADGGIGWENNWLAVVPYRGAWSMSIVDDNNGFLLGSHYMETDPEILHRSGDGGITWHSVPGSNASILRGIATIGFVSAETGWAGGAAVMKTEDGGHTWTTQIEPAAVREFFFFDELEGYAVGKTSVLHTVDGGATWIDVAPADDRIVDLRSVHFIDRDRGWIAGRGAEELIGERVFQWSIVLATADGGATWSIRPFAWETTSLETALGEEPAILQGL